MPIINTIIGPIALSSALAACPAALGHQAVQVRIETEAPARHSRDFPEQPEPEHPAHEDPMGTFRGLVAQNISNTASASGGSPFGAHIPSSIWPENNLVMISSVKDLGISNRRPAIPRLNLNVSPNASRHIANRSTTEIRKANTRRQC